MSGRAEAPVSAEVVAGYRALRSGAGAHRLPRDVLWLRGPEAVDYLQGQCSQDVAALAPGGAADALLLAPDGKLVALVRVTRVAENGFVLDTDGGFGAVVEERLRRFRLRSKFDLTALDWSCLALRGPALPEEALSEEALSEEALSEEARPAGPVAPGGDGLPTGPLALSVSWNGWRGTDLLGPGDPAAPAGVPECDDAAWEACRIESGVPRMGRELDQRTIAAEAGLVERTVSFTKGCFTGQELVARLDSRGSRVARRLCGVVLADLGPGQGSRLVGGALGGPDPDRPLGAVTSAAWSPGLGAWVGLAYAHRSLEVPGPVTVVLAGGEDPGRPASPGPGEPGERVGAELRPLPLVPGAG